LITLSVLVTEELKSLEKTSGFTRKKRMVVIKSYKIETSFKSVALIFFSSVSTIFLLTNTASPILAESIVEKEGSKLENIQPLSKPENFLDTQGLYQQKPSQDNLLIEINSNHQVAQEFKTLKAQFFPGLIIPEPIIPWTMIPEPIIPGPIIPEPIIPGPIIPEPIIPGPIIPGPIIPEPIIPGPPVFNNFVSGEVTNKVDINKVMTSRENASPDLFLKDKKSEIWQAKFSGTGNAGINIDPVQVAKEIESLINRNNNRDGFVKNIMNHAFYNWGKQQYNVMVFNLSQEYKQQFRNVKYYDTANYQGITYGIWIFESGTFENKGDGGWINWAFSGWFERNDKYVTFTKP